jgi:hypothetical protein
MFRTTRISRALALGAVAALLLAGCGSDDDDAAPSGGADVTAADTSEAADTDTGDGDGDAGTSGGSGTVTLDGEAVELREVRCFLESQPAAAGGGNILFVVQGEGEDAAGESLLIDVSRYDEGSQFAGDSISIDVGDVMAGESVSYSASADTGTVTLDGSTASAQDVALIGDGGSEHVASFEITC